MAGINREEAGERGGRGETEGTPAIRTGLQVVSALRPPFPINQIMSTINMFTNQKLCELLRWLTSCGNLR